MIVILTALDIEHAAVRAHLTGVKRYQHEQGTLFDVGVLAARPSRRVALARIGMGNLAAATLTERAIAEFHPSMAMFVGIAGGRKPWLRLGHVVVATRVYAFQGGRSEDDAFHVRPRSWEISHRAEQAAGQIAESSEWYDALGVGGPTPRVHFAPIAAGEVLLDSNKSDVARLLDDSYNDTAAIEMESAGFAAASHLNERVPCVTIRGVSDPADGSKATTDQQGWREIAARNAAAFAVALAAELDDPDDADGRSTAGGGVAAAPPIRNTNVAKGNARVGNQIGVVFGDLRSTSERD